MPSSHDLHQDQRLDDLTAQAATFRKKIAANVRKMQEISKRINALTPKSGQSDHPSEKPPAKSSRRRTPPKRGNPK